MKQAFVVMEKHYPYWYSYPVKVFTDIKSAELYVEQENEKKKEMMQTFELDEVFYIESIDLIN
jgi:hypothetical protein